MTSERIAVNLIAKRCAVGAPDRGLIAQVLERLCRGLSASFLLFNEKRTGIHVALFAGFLNGDFFRRRFAQLASRQSHHSNQDQMSHSWSVTQTRTAGQYRNSQPEVTAPLSARQGAALAVEAPNTLPLAGAFTSLTPAQLPAASPQSAAGFS